MTKIRNGVLVSQGSHSNNTITVAKSGANNIALGNSTSYNKYGTITTAYKYVTKEQKWFVVIGTGLSTGGTDSYLWWLNGLNNAGQYAPDKTKTLDDNRVLFAWDLSSSTLSGINGNLQDEEVNHLDGWTGFGLTATNGSATIYDINFYTDDELTAMLGASHFCEAISSHWSIEPDPATAENGALFYVDQADKEDASGMTPPYMTYYTWEGDVGYATNHLPAAVISHDQLTLTPGLYEISMDIRIIDYDTDATVGEGTLFSATTGSTTVSQDIKLGVDANDGSYTENGDHEDLYGTYTIYVQVTADAGSDTGSLSISLTIPEGATYNWISWKNLTVTAIESEPTVEWTLGAQYGTLMLPFACTLTDGLKAYTISEVSNNEVTLEEAASIEAGTPYIVGGTASKEAISFTGMPTAYNVSYTGTDGYLTGVQKETTAPAGSYVLQMQGEDETPAFYLVAESENEEDAITVGEYHCYLNYTATAGAKLVVNFPDTDDVATRIDAVETEETANDAIYDLSGRRVAKAQKGVYIVNGKKMVIK